MPSNVESVSKTYREIIQHAKAAQHIFDEIAFHGRDLTEELIMTTHRLLTYKVDHDADMQWTQYSGVYRTTPVQSGFTTFPDAARIPKLMREFIHELHTDLTNAAARATLDPIALAAKYCHKFVNIHPFADGNGRMCRLTLSALLLKDGGVIVYFGEDNEDKKTYLGVASSGSMGELSSLDDYEDVGRAAEALEGAGKFHSSSCGEEYARGRGALGKLMQWMGDRPGGHETCHESSRPSMVMLAEWSGCSGTRC